MSNEKFKINSEIQKTFETTSYDLEYAPEDFEELSEIIGDYRDLAMEMRSTAHFIRKEVIKTGFERLKGEESYLNDWIDFYDELRDDFLEFKHNYSDFIPSIEDFDKRAECHHFSLEAEQVINELKLKVPDGRLESLDEMNSYFEEWKL